MSGDLLVDYLGELVVVNAATARLLDWFDSIAREFGSVPQSGSEVVGLPKDFAEMTGDFLQQSHLWSPPWKINER